MSELALTGSSFIGYADEKSSLGLMYERRPGVIQDYIRAYMWWNIAASSGNEDAIRGLGIIEEQMTSTQVGKAMKFARECVAKEYKDC